MSFVVVLFLGMSDKFSVALAAIFTFIPMLGNSARL